MCKFVRLCYFLLSLLIKDSISFVVTIFDADDISDQMPAYIMISSSSSAIDLYKIFIKSIH